MKIIAILRIKNEILVIDECLSRLSELVDEIVIVDNGSTDGTLDAYSRHPKVAEVIRTEGFDEGRDKNMLLDAAKKREPDWVIWMDGDEVFERNFTRGEIEEYGRKGYGTVSFRLCHFWMSKDRCRYDGTYFLYSLIPQVRMWRNEEKSYFADKKIHNGTIQGVGGRSYFSPYRIKHYGYIDRRKVEEKHNLYTKVDESGTRTYDHIRPDARAKTYTFLEFAGMWNSLFIILWKKLLDAIWVVARAVLKLRKLKNYLLSVRKR